MGLPGKLILKVQKPVARPGQKIAQVAHLFHRGHMVTIAI
jgi:hypothetical protein